MGRKAEVRHSCEGTREIIWSVRVLLSNFAARVDVVSTILGEQCYWHLYEKYRSMDPIRFRYSQLRVSRLERALFIHISV
jgi:hypothetical protein